MSSEKAFFFLPKFYLFECQSFREGRREIFHLLVHFCLSNEKYINLFKKKVSINFPLTWKAEWKSGSSVWKREREWQRKNLLLLDWLPKSLYGIELHESEARSLWLGLGVVMSEGLRQSAASRHDALGRGCAEDIRGCWIWLKNRNISYHVMDTVASKW